MTEEARPAEVLAREAEGAALIDLVTEVRGGSRLSPPELTRLDQVRLLLVADHIPLSDPRAAFSLAPIVCTSASQQARFLESFAARFGVAPEALPPPPERPTLEPVPLPWWRRWRLLIALAVFVAIAGCWLWSLWPEKSAPPPPDAPTATQMARILFGGGEASGLSTVVSWWLLLSIASALLLAMLMAGHRWWRRRRRRKAADAFEPDHFAARGLAVAAAFPHLYGGMRLRRRLAGLRRHRIVPSARIHVGRSIAATVRAGGRPVIVFATRPVAPDYVILADRASPRDHLPLLGHALSSRLASEGVGGVVYEFFGDPRLVRSTRPGEEGTELGIDGFAARHEGARLLLLAEASRCLTADGEVAPWLDDLPEERALLDPKLEAGWDRAEEQLRQSGLPVFSASTEGVGRYADAVRARDAQDSSRPVRSDWKFDLPSVLHRHRAALIGDSAMPETDIRDLIEDLEAWLGPEGMTVLRAVAVFPLVEPTLTLLLSTRYADEHGMPLLTEERFLALARLPWMRLGYMPRWLRLPLVRGLAQPHLEIAVRTMHAFLNPVRSGPKGRLKLDFSQADDPEARRRLLDWLRANPSSLYSDVLLFDALSGRLPEELGTEFDPAGEPAFWRYLRRLDAWRDSVALLATLVLTMTVAFLQPARERVEINLPKSVPRAGPPTDSVSGPVQDPSRSESTLSHEAPVGTTQAAVPEADPGAGPVRPDLSKAALEAEERLRREQALPGASGAGQPIDPVGQTASISGSQPVYVRTVPKLSSSAVATLRPGEAFTVVGQVADWWRIRLKDGLEGYVSKGLLNVAGPGPRREDDEGCYEAPTQGSFMICPGRDQTSVIATVPIADPANLDGLIKALDRAAESLAPGRGEKLDVAVLWQPHECCEADANARMIESFVGKRLSVYLSTEYYKVYREEMANNVDRPELAVRIVRLRRTDPAPS